MNSGVIWTCWCLDCELLSGGIRKHLACIARRYAKARAGLGDYLKVACQGKSLECS